MYIALDLALLLLATLRISRLITSDNIPGSWWIYNPLYKKAALAQARDHRTPRWSKYLEGLTCPFCVGFWIGLIGVISLYLVGGPGDAPDLWRWLAAPFALNYVVGHVAKRLD